MMVDVAEARRVDVRFGEVHIPPPHRQWNQGVAYSVVFQIDSHYSKQVRYVSH